jgi:hypothetical protein
VLRFLHQLSAFLFYILGASFFVAYLLYRNSIEPVWSAWWLQVADVPFLFTAMVYGGTSLYLSLYGSKKSVIGAIVLVILLVLLAVFAALNYWPLITQ